MSLNLSSIAEQLVPLQNYTVRVTLSPYNTHTDAGYRPHSHSVSLIYLPRKKD